MERENHGHIYNKWTTLSEPAKNLHISYERKEKEGRKNDEKNNQD